MSQHQQVEQLRLENSQLQTENAGLILANSKLRGYFKEANLRSIINTRHVQIFTSINEIVSKANSGEITDDNALKHLSFLLSKIEQEATPS